MDKTLHHEELSESFPHFDDGICAGCAAGDGNGRPDRAPDLHCTCERRWSEAVTRSISLDIGLGWMQVVRTRDV